MHCTIKHHKLWPAFPLVFAVLVWTGCRKSDYFVDQEETVRDNGAGTGMVTWTRDRSYILEGLVFGRIAGQSVCRQEKGKAAEIKHPSIKYEIPHSERTRLDASDVRNSLRALMWRNVGITRTKRQLVEAREIIRFWQRYVMDKIFDSPEGWECQNMLTTSLLMAQTCQQRQESRGVHFRRDYTKTDDENFKRHIEIQRSN